MPRISLKNILTKNKDVLALFSALIQRLDGNIWIEEETGKLVYGTSMEGGMVFPVYCEGEFLGAVKGESDAKLVADLLTQLLQKESEKKRLGNEVLNLYQEINLIFNFSEKLATTIDAPSICAIALTEASHVIQTDSGIVILWDEENKKLQGVASVGDRFINTVQVDQHTYFLSKIVISGQSEIINDTSALIETGIILPDVRSIVYSALKVKHRVMGAIILVSEDADAYKAADLKLLTTLALQSSAAIESALLYERNIREVKEREEALRYVYEATAKFVPYEFIGSLGRKVITEVRLGDHVEKIVTVLFSDIRDYTTLSEKMTPEENFRFVCSFNERMGPIIRKNNGFINQYLGDAIMAIFPRNAADALKAAIEMQAALSELNTERKSKGLRTIQIGVGMHTGPLIMGITGDHFRLDATTISDTVNTASRIESLTKYYKADIIISDACFQQLSEPDSFYLRYLGLVQLKGKQEPTGVYECFDSNEKEEQEWKITTLASFNEGVIHYLNRSFETAQKYFAEVTEVHPNDRTAQFFYSRAEQQLLNSLQGSEDWTGVVEMLEK